MEASPKTVGVLNLGNMA